MRQVCHAPATEEWGLRLGKGLPLPTHIIHCVEGSRAD